MNKTQTPQENDVDTLVRCSWVTADPEYRRYHDEEWGVPIRGDRELFERLALEGFQAGLSWLTVLRKRCRFRERFHGFDPAVVAEFGDAEIDELMQDAGLIRNRIKIAATINNAKLVAAMAPNEFSDFLWSFAPADHAAPQTTTDVPARTPESEAMSRGLRARGFKFVGPVTMYALMQATGMVNDHLLECQFRETNQHREATSEARTSAVAQC